MKGAISLVALTFFLMMLTLPALASLVDPEKFEQFKQSQLQAVVDEVLKNGKSAVTVPIAGDYDANKDGYIDTKEVKAIEDYLASLQKK